MNSHVDDLFNEWMNEWMIGVLGHDSAPLYCAGDNLGEYDEFCYESCPWCRIDRSTFWPAVQRATTVPRTPPRRLFQYISLVKQKNYEYLCACFQSYLLPLCSHALILICVSLEPMHTVWLLAELWHLSIYFG